MGDAVERSGGRFGDTGVIELTGKILVVAIVLLFFVVVFVFCLHLYAKWFWYRRQETSTATATRRRRRLEFPHDAPPPPSALRRGLDPSLLNTIPITMFDPKEFKEGLECAVCLCEVCEGEKARLLPKCNHGFHVDCIDMWFQSHSTCPLCRNPVASSSDFATGDAEEGVIQAPVVEDSVVVAIEIPNFPTNVLIWGNETQVSTFGPCAEEGHQGNAETSSSSPSPSSSSSLSSSSMASTSSGAEEDEQKSAVPTRLRSLKRLLSGSRRVNPSSPRNLDLEQGVRGLS